MINTHSRKKKVVHSNAAKKKTPTIVISYFDTHSHSHSHRFWFGCSVIHLFFTYYFVLIDSSYHIKKLRGNNNNNNNQNKFWKLGKVFRLILSPGEYICNTNLGYIELTQRMLHFITYKSISVFYPIPVNSSSRYSQLRLSRCVLYPSYSQMREIRKTRKRKRGSEGYRKCKKNEEERNETT